jgi:hypothetical protein
MRTLPTGIATGLQEPVVPQATTFASAQACQRVNRCLPGGAEQAVSDSGD